jgi:hypothetical protein
MRSIIAVGIVEVSCRPRMLIPRRLPLTRISVCCGARLRRLMKLPPTAGPAARGVARLSAGEPAAVMFCRMSVIDWKPCRSMSARVMLSTGAAVSRSTWRMREPVTSMRSRVVGSGVSPLSCAMAASGNAVMLRAAVAASARRTAPLSSWDRIAVSAGVMDTAVPSSEITNA